MQEKQILGMITSEASWEQVIYQIVAWEGLDPWDLDLVVLSKGFLSYIRKLAAFDFKMPAKYLMVAAVLLRMKSDHLRLMEIVEASEVCDMPELEAFELDPDSMLEGEPALEINPITAPPKRLARRRVMVDDLVLALRRVMRAQERRERRQSARRQRIRISREDITQKINALYEKINGLIKEMDGNEVKFTRVVGDWKRGNIVDNFLPMVHLDDQGRIAARQEEVFEEIFIKRRKDKITHERKQKAS